MTRPTKHSFQALAAPPLDAIEYLRPIILGMDDYEARDHWASIETFVAIGLRIMAKTNPSKIRSEAMTVELSTLISPNLPTGEATDSSMGEFDALSNKEK